MGYSTTDARPFEGASKAEHHHIINDASVQKVLDGLWIPPRLEEGSIAGMVQPFEPADGGITSIVAVDGGYTEIILRKTFPSATIHFFQFGALLLKRAELQRLNNAPFVSPEDMATLRDIQRLKLAVPTKNVRDRHRRSLKETVRAHVYEFFQRETLGESTSLLDTLKWFVFRLYKSGSQREAKDSWWELSSSPFDGDVSGCTLDLQKMSSTGTFVCPQTGQTLFLTDIFRFHEVIEEETGAAGICSYLASVIEHVVVLHIIRALLKSDPEQLKHVLFILDRPTGFFGQTARLHNLMKQMVNWLFDNHGLFLAGLEKSGAFVDHAREIQGQMPRGSFLILGDKYIYKYISPGQEDAKRAYASTSYYGHKVLFRAKSGEMYVVSVPVRSLQKEPTTSDLPNLQKILTLIEELRCDLYESAIIPVALANKLVSLSAHPSSQILRAFAKDKVGS